MRTGKIFAFLLAAGLTFGLAMGTARADGVAINTKELAQKDRTSLTTAIQKARAANPTVFQQVENVAKRVNQIDKEKRGRFAIVTPFFTVLKKPALLPMLEMLAVQGPARAKYSDTAWQALRVALIEAVGHQRDAVALPVLNAILDSDKDWYVVRAAAEAMGKIGDDASANKLVDLAVKPGARQTAVLSGISACRRSVVAQGLSKFLANPPDTQTTKIALKSLGSVGNSWAWQTPTISKTGEGTAVRQTAAAALVDAFVRYDDPDLRLTAQKAILVVDDDSTPSLVAAKKSGASKETQAALDKLIVRFEKLRQKK